MIKFLTNAISRALSFSKTEARGTVLLIFIMISFPLAITIIGNTTAPNTSTENQDEELLAEWVRETRESVKEKEKVIENPNFLALEVSSSSNIAVDQLGEKQEEDVSQLKKPSAIPHKTEDINTALAADLQKVNGIGPVFSERIIKFRNLLGGYSSIDQLHEVYGLDSSLVNKIDDLFDVRSEVTPLAINSDSVKTLIKHPYISYDLAWNVINYRKQHGDIHGVEDFAKIQSVDDSLILKLRPYLE